MHVTIPIIMRRKPPTEHPTTIQIVYLLSDGYVDEDEPVIVPFVLFEPFD